MVPNVPVSMIIYLLEKKLVLNVSFCFYIFYYDEGLAIALLRSVDEGCGLTSPLKIDPSLCMDFETKEDRTKAEDVMVRPRPVELWQCKNT